MNVLTPAQRGFLSKFFATETGRAFYLTGGGALSEFYLEHRASLDIDVFTQDMQAWENVEADLHKSAEASGVGLEFRPAKPPNELHRAFLRVPGEDEIKIDVVRDSPPHFGETHIEADGIVVDALENIAVGKLAALCGRGYPRDFVDIYFLLQENFDMQQLVALLKVKDPGVYDGYIAEMLRRVLRLEPEDLPSLLKPIEFEDMQQLFVKLADDLTTGSSMKPVSD